MFEHISLSKRKYIDICISIIKETDTQGCKKRSYYTIPLSKLLSDQEKQRFELCCVFLIVI